MQSVERARPRPADLTTLDLYLSTERVIGQERARRQLAVMLKRQMGVAQGQWPRSECAVVGGFTGVGKSYMARMMCEACGLPFADVDATRYTETGYAGDDLPQLFLPLLESAAVMHDKRLRMEPPSVSSVLKRADIDW